MSELGQVLALAGLPAVGNIAGGVLAEVVETSRRTLSLALHLAAGIVFGVIAVELAPRAFDGAPPWMAAAGILAGGGFYLALQSLVQRVSVGMRGGACSRGSADKTGPPVAAWMIYGAVAVDLFSDGLLIGAGSSVSFNLAVLLALGQVTADVPEGFATIASLKAAGVARGTRLLTSASFMIPVMAGALASYFLLRDVTEALKLTALAFTAGLLLVAATEEIIGEAHEAASDTKVSVLATTGGFALFALLASYFNG